MGNVPDADLTEIQRFCEEKVPPEHADQIRITHELRGKTVTILECIKGWPDSSVARMKHDPEGGGWTLYWFDRNLRAHRYDLIDPNQSIGRILDEVDRDPTCIFWG